MSRARDREIVAKSMRAVHSQDTLPELLLRQALHRMGVRFRLHRRDLPGVPDIVFPRQRVAVFVDGDFWHGHQWKQRGLPSLDAAFTSNRPYWIVKISRNVERDRLATERLMALGWHVIRVWESAIRASPSTAAAHIVSELAAIRTDG